MESHTLHLKEWAWFAGGTIAWFRAPLSCPAQLLYSTQHLRIKITSSRIHLKLFREGRVFSEISLFLKNIFLIIILFILLSALSFIKSIVIYIFIKFVIF